MQFAEVAAPARRHKSLANIVKKKRHRLRLNIEQHGWDGFWYRRAYFDDGTPLVRLKTRNAGLILLPKAGPFCPGPANDKRFRLAMESLSQHLVRSDIGIVQLLDPPFDKSNLNPGYIKGYVPGVRENGGQYTHGAIWAAMAFAALRDNRARLGNYDDDQPGKPRKALLRQWRPIKWSRMLSRPMSMRSRRIPAAAAGRGTPARRLDVPADSGIASGTEA